MSYSGGWANKEVNLVKWCDQTPLNWIKRWGWSLMEENPIESLNNKPWILHVDAVWGNVSPNLVILIFKCCYHVLASWRNLSNIGVGHNETAIYSSHLTVIVCCHTYTRTSISVHNSRQETILYSHRLISLLLLQISHYNYLQSVIDLYLHSINRMMMLFVKSYDLCHPKKIPLQMKSLLKIIETNIELVSFVWSQHS